jgi:hypothetical protein
MKDYKLRDLRDRGFFSFFFFSFKMRLLFSPFKNEFVQDSYAFADGIINVQNFPADYARRCHRHYSLGAAACRLPAKLVFIGARRRVQCCCATSTDLLQSASTGAFERFKRRAGLFAATKRRCAN